LARASDLRWPFVLRHVSWRADREEIRHGCANLAATLAQDFVRDS